MQTYRTKMKSGEIQKVSFACWPIYTVVSFSLQSTYWHWEKQEMM